MTAAFPARMAGKSPERSKFKRTCSLLRQCLKEKGGLDTLRHGMGLDFNQTGLLEESGGRPEAMDLLPQMGSTKGGLQLYCAEIPDLNASPLPELSSPRDADDLTAAETVKSAAAQLTMFFAGRVVVFDDFPADKAKELMLLASEACSQDTGASPIMKAPPIAPDAGSLPSEQHNPAPPWSNPSSPSPSPGRRLADVSDLPIARKNSLNRFLEKRKDRISAKAPYPAPPPPAGSAKPPESNSCLGLTSQSDLILPYQIRKNASWTALELIGSSGLSPEPLLISSKLES